jgi:DhnA family fructose-bisphosphate aldolase class Ia
MNGKLLRFEKLFEKGENAVVIAIDHGLFDGPIPGLENVSETLRRVNPSVDGILMSLGTLNHCRDFFNFKGAPIPIVRLNWSDVYCFHWNYNAAKTVVSHTVKEAISYGAEIVLVSLTIATGNPETDVSNIEIFTRLSRQAHEYGVPVIGEFFPTHSNSLTPDELHDKVLSGCRILNELGADMIKTFYTYKFKKVTSSCKIPVLGLGAEKTSQLNALNLASNEIKDGAKGVVFGRNAFQVPDPLKFQSALLDVVKRKSDPVEVYKKYRLKD